VFVHVCIHACMTHLHVCVSAIVRVCVCVCVCMCMREYTDVNTHIMHALWYLWKRRYVRTYVSTCMYAYVYIYIYIYIYIHTYTYIHAGTYQTV
jgi:hypothetical protein